jgi:hypothetical protein
MKRQFFLTLAYIFLSLFSFAQSIRILEPENLSICEDALVTMEVNNDTDVALNGIVFDLSLSCSVSYIAGTIVGAEESNITDLSSPNFSLASIPANSTYRIEISVHLDCNLQGCIDSGEIPEVGVNLNFDNGEISDTQDYLVEATLVLITAVSDPVVFALPGDVIIRTSKESKN